MDSRFGIRSSIRSTWKPVLAVVFAVLLVAISGFIAPAGAETGVPLPAPVSAGNSVELCLNSRVSEHILPNSTATDQQLSQVLWAAGKAPITGSYRNIKVTTPNGTYLYHPNNHSLSYYSSTPRDQGAFYITYEYESKLDFDAGVSYMPALLAAVSLWNSTEPQLASCPKGNKLYFGIKDVRGLNSTLVAHSSDGSLRDPETDGDNDLEDVLANLKYTNTFDQKEVPLQKISQILWAGYGCTPHETFNNRKGLTVPSAYASYYLTGKIYLANQSGVFRYHNRNPSDNLATRDHRIEPIKWNTDVISDLRANISRLPQQAPYYIILCLDSYNATQSYARLETGFVAGNMLMQASAKGLGCYFTTKLTAQEQSDIRNVTGIPQTDVPHAIVSIGKPSKPVPTVISTDDDGNEKRAFLPGEKVSVKAHDLSSNTNYTIWIQPQFVGEGDKLNASKDPSGDQEQVKTDDKGTFDKTLIWSISPEEKVTAKKWDIVVDKEGAGEGRYNAEEDGIDAVNTYGIVAPIPEASTVLLVGVGVATLFAILFTRQRKQ